MNLSIPIHGNTTLKIGVTPDFSSTIRERTQSEKNFWQALLRKAVDYFSAIVGFQALEEETGIPAKSLIRIFGLKDSRSAANWASILNALQKNEGVRLALS